MLRVAMISKWHVHAAEYAGRLSKMEDVQITCVWDEEPARGRAWAEELGADFEENLDALLARPDVDAVCIDTPTNMHKEVMIKAAKAGKHIVCGGTTSTVVARYLHKELRPSLNFVADDIPPTAEIEGVDLVTEGVITVNKVLSYAQDYLKDNETYSQWAYKQDGASQIARLLFEEATDINFFVGRAINPAHQNPDLPINFSIKMNLVKDLCDCLQKMGKRVKVSYF